MKRRDTPVYVGFSCCLSGPCVCWPGCWSPKQTFLLSQVPEVGTAMGSAWRHSECEFIWTWVSLGPSHWTQFFYTVFSNVPNLGSAVSFPVGEEGWTLFLSCLLSPPLIPIPTSFLGNQQSRCPHLVLQHHPPMALGFTRCISGYLDDCVVADHCLTL